MILTCPNCSTRFLLSAQILAPEGRYVKCCKCGETWFQVPDADELINDLEQQIEEIPEAVKPVPEGSSVPAVVEGEGGEGRVLPSSEMMGYAGAGIVFVLILGALLLFKAPITHGWPASAAFYQLFGMKIVPQGQGLEFDRVRAEAAGPDSLKVEGYILNLKSQGQVIPMVEVALKDSAGEVVDVWFVAPSENYLEAEESLPFSAVREGVPAGVESLHLRFVLSGETESESKGAHEKADVKGEAHTEAGGQQGESHAAPARDSGHDSGENSGHSAAPAHH